MKNLRFLPIGVLAMAIIPVGLLLLLSSSILRQSIKNSVVNDPQSALSQSLIALPRAINDQIVNGELLFTLQVAGKDELKKVLSAPAPAAKAVSTIGLAEAKESKKPLMVITDKKGNVLYSTLDIPKPTPSAASSSSKKKTKGPTYPNVMDWAGMSRAMSGLNSDGLYYYQGTFYFTAIAPIRSHNQTLGVVIGGDKMDQGFITSLKSSPTQEMAFYSQGQTFCTKPGPLPPVDIKKLATSGNPPVEWQRVSYLVGVCGIEGLDSKTAGSIIVFQPIQQTLTVEGTPQKNLVKTGFFLIFIAILGALAFLWFWMVPFNRLLTAMDQIKKGDLNPPLPLNRPDELGRMARSLKEMLESLQEKDRISLVLGKVVDPQAAKKILGDKDYFALKGERRECTLLQADLKGFNTLSENMPPAALVEALNQYFSIINEVVFKYEGMLDKFIGDTAIAVWGAPFTHEDKEARAVKSALEIQEALKDFNISRIKTGHPPFTVGIGIHTGTVVSGNLGSDKHYDYSIIGEPLHVVARLCSMATPGQTVVSEETYDKIQSLVKAGPLNPIAVKGSMSPLKTFEINQLT